MADLQRKTANLFDLSAYYSVDSGITDITINGSSLTYNVSGNLRAIRYRFDLNPSDVYTISLGNNSSKVRLELRYLKDGAQVGGSITIAIGESRTITGSSSYDQFLIYISNGSNTGECVADEIMLNTGSTALPYEPYGWVRSLRKLGTSTDTLTTLPANLYADGNSATVGLKGNMSQTGTPTPITPSECGERTGNLCYLYKTGYRLDGTGNEIEAENYNIYAVSASANTTYTINADYGSAGTTTLRIIAYNNGSFSYKIAEVNLNAVPYAFTTPSNCDEVKFSLSNQSTNIMFNTGSTTKPFEPYGYKIPISSANTTTPVYLGEVETTRKIKKLVLNGVNEGEWKKSSARTGSFYLNIGTNAITGLGLCDRAVNVETIEQYNSIGKMYIEASGTSKIINLWLFDTNISLDDFKAYLQAQYAAGTPICVWYALATETTGIVNEPIRKIGEYADSVSGITIHTIAGGDTLSVGTTLQPSEVTVNYKGWHPVQSVHERENGAWD